MTTAAALLALVVLAAGRFLTQEGTYWNLAGLVVVAVWSGTGAARRSAQPGARVSRVCGAALATGVASGLGFALVTLFASGPRAREVFGATAGSYSDSFLAHRGSGSLVVGLDRGPWAETFGSGFVDCLPTVAVFVCAFTAAAAVGTALGVVWARSGARVCAAVAAVSLLLAVLVAVVLDATGTTPWAPWPGVVLLCPPTAVAALAVGAVWLSRFGRPDTRR